MILDFRQPYSFLVNRWLLTYQTSSYSPQASLVLNPNSGEGVLLLFWILIINEMVYILQILKQNANFTDIKNKSMINVVNWLLHSECFTRILLQKTVLFSMTENNCSLTHIPLKKHFRHFWLFLFYSLQYNIICTNVHIKQFSNVLNIIDCIKKINI